MKITYKLDIYHPEAEACVVMKNRTSIKFPISEFFSLFSKKYRDFSINLALIHDHETYEEAILEKH